MKRLYATVAAVLLTSQAFAAEPVMGFYLGAGVGNAQVTLEDADTANDFEGDDTGVRIMAGYRLFRYFAVEANYEDYGTVDDTLFGVNLQGDFSAFQVSAVGLIPLGSVDLFGKLGFGAWEGTLSDGFGFEYSEDNVDPVAGLGVQFRSGRMAVRLEAQSQLLGFDDDGDDDADGDDTVGFTSFSFAWSF